MIHNHNLEHPEVTRALQFGSRWTDEIDRLDMSIFGSEAMQKYHGQERFFRESNTLHGSCGRKKAALGKDVTKEGERFCN